jgi:ferredoxin
MTTPKKKARKKIVVELTRGDVLKVAAAAVGSIIAAPLLTTGPLSPFGQLKQGQLEGEDFAGHGAKTGQHHWGMVINLDQCIGCEYCMRACSATNDVMDGEPWNIVIPEKNSGGHTFFLSRPCLHCQNAPCVEVCPVKATYPSGRRVGRHGLRPLHRLPLLSDCLPVRCPPVQLGNEE